MHAILSFELLRAVKIRTDNRKRFFSNSCRQIPSSAMDLMKAAIKAAAFAYCALSQKRAGTDKSVRQILYLSPSATRII